MSLSRELKYLSYESHVKLLTLLLKSTKNDSFLQISYFILSFHFFYLSVIPMLSLSLRFLSPISLLSLSITSFFLSFLMYIHITFFIFEISLPGFSLRHFVRFSIYSLFYFYVSTSANYCGKCYHHHYWSYRPSGASIFLSLFRQCQSFPICQINFFSIFVHIILLSKPCPTS